MATAIDLARGWLQLDVLQNLLKIVVAFRFLIADRSSNIWLSRTHENGQ
jgi:hypothetical protein